jgi:hypothetical protein
VDRSTPTPACATISGAATYEKTLTIPKAWLKSGARLSLDLGEVREFATVTLNGKALTVLWKPPFAVDVTDQLKPGVNRLEHAGRELLGQPDDRRPAARRGQALHLRAHPAVPARLDPCRPRGCWGR